MNNLSNSKGNLFLKLSDRSLVRLRRVSGQRVEVEHASKRGSWMMPVEQFSNEFVDMGVVNLSNFNLSQFIRGLNR